MKNILLCLTVVLLGYWWKIRTQPGPGVAQIVTSPLALRTQTHKIERHLLETTGHNSWQFPIAVLESLMETPRDTVVISGWDQLVNKTEKTGLGISFMNRFNVTRLVLMRDTMKSYSMEFNEDADELIVAYSRPMTDTIDLFFGKERQNTTYASIELTPQDFQLNTTTNIPLLPEPQQQYFANMPEYRYFKEGSLLGESGLAHYDLRFYKGRIEPMDRVATLHRIVRSWSRFTNQMGIKTWIAHGSLLGYFFNGMILPWDDDLDVQVSAGSFWELVKMNQTLVVDYNDVDALGSYLIDVNPWFVHRGRNPDNKIDARWIDIETGLYIDITTLTSELSPLQAEEQMDQEEKVELSKVFDPYYDPAVMTEAELHESEIHQVMNKSLATRSLISCKDLHFYTAEELSPLIPTVYEGTIVYVPNNINNLLLREYKGKSLYLHDFKGFQYDKHQKTWTHPEIKSEYNALMKQFIDHHYKIKQTTFKRHIFHAEDLVEFPNFKLDPQLRDIQVE